MTRLRRSRSSTELSSTASTLTCHPPFSESQPLPDAVRRVGVLFDENTTVKLHLTAYPAVTYCDNGSGYSFVGNEAGLDPALWLCELCRRLMETPPPLIDLRPTESQLNEIRANLNRGLHELGRSKPMDPKSTTERPESVEDWQLHHANLFQLIDCCYSTRKPCQLCQVIWRGVMRGLSSRRTKKGRAVYRYNMDDWLSGPRHLDCHAGLRIARILTSGTGCILCLNLPLTRGGWAPRWLWLSLSREHSSSRGNSQLSDSTGSEESLKQIRRWVTACESSHPRCRLSRRSSDEHPTRLLLLDSACATAQLVDASSLTDPGDNSFPEYVALSYRWGSNSASKSKDAHTRRASMLTKATEQHLRAGVDVESLPRTIRDACKVVTGMGYRHIWIDRFCIFQDSAEDWNREATRMAQVYKYAIFTISASCAADEDDGLFRYRGVDGGGVAPLKFRSNPLIPPQLIEQHKHTLEKDTGPEFYYHLASQPPSHDGDPATTKLGYLASRGWILQERVLSKRVVHFSGENLFSECSMFENSEENIYNNEPGTYERLTVAMDNTNEIYGVKYIWATMVQLYSKYELTFPGDRLPALSGLAKETKRITRSTVADEEYYAGLWKSTFVHDLCWDDFSRMPRTGTEAYIAPSWSWASYKNHITWSMYASDDTTRQLAHLQDIRLKYAGEDTYGAVLDGWMLLEGHLIEVMVREVDVTHRMGNWPGGVRRILSLGNDECQTLPFVETQDGALEVDHLVESLGSVCIQLFCVPLVQDGGAPHAWKPVVWCLLLGRYGTVRYCGHRQQMQGPDGEAGGERRNHYQRVGWIKLNIETVEDWNAWLASNPKQKIVVW